MAAQAQEAAGEVHPQPLGARGATGSAQACAAGGSGGFSQCFPKTRPALKLALPIAQVKPHDNFCRLAWNESSPG